ncbi:ABC-type multidrug/protein/lipid transport system, ATPase component [Corynebacterium kutscheri]|uniref:ABC transporter ATP-binding protein n=1 Tax=Corynebacterium kutscheri TaxID=35755 RepID=UPI000F6EB0AA|nr:ABC transporter ATP-binding protein [Corynebacterium kutscheri]VEH79569.1 ABC-type multidrug/protein/lipid transport system, ATPase component [Corynebacterium kutscheri]
MNSDLHFPLARVSDIRSQLSVQLRAIPRARWWFLLAVVLLICGAVATTWVPIMLGRIIDIVSSSDNSAHASTQLIQLAMVTAFIVLVAAIANALGFYLISRLAERIIANLREDMVSTALGLPTHQVEDAGTGDLISRSTDDVATLSQSVTESIPVLTTALFTVVVTGIALFSIEWQFFFIPLAAAPIYYWGARQYLRVAPARYAAERASMGERAHRVLEAIRGRDTVRAYRMEEVMHNRVSEASWQVVTRGMRARMTMLTLNSWLILGEWVMLFFALLLGFFLVRSHSVSIGGVTAAVLLLIRIRGPINMLMRVLDTVQSGYASLARIVGVSVNPPVEVPSSHAGVPRGEVELKQVNFSYQENQWAVRNVNMRIEPGQTVAIVGASGAGKTTVAALVAGLREPSSGQVLIDGQEVTTFSDAERKARLAMVSQEVYVFSGTLREDLTLARPDATDEELIHVLNRVHALEWFEQLVDGFDTVVGARGLAIEPLEAQQLALARILLLDPAIVIMDEATAEAGSQGATALEQAAEEVTRDRTALVVAHRLDQAQAADVVVVMEAGEIVEAGSHAELLSLQGRYHTLWQAWIKGRS